MLAKSITLIDDVQIIKQFSEGMSETAASLMINKYKNFVYSTALRYLLNYDDADDITQDVFIKAIAKIDKFKGNSSLKTWLYRITTNHCISFLRKKKLRNFFSFGTNINNEAFDIKDMNSKPDELIEYKELNDMFFNYLTKLPDRQRETFVLRYYEDLSYEEFQIYWVYL